MAAKNTPPLPTLPALVADTDQPTINPSINIPYSTGLGGTGLGGSSLGFTPNIAEMPMTSLQNRMDNNLKGLSGALNQIAIDLRAGGGGTGGGSEPLEGNQDPNPLIRFNPYLGKNVTSFNKGGVMQQMNMLAPYISNRMIRQFPMFDEGGEMDNRPTMLPRYGYMNPKTQQIIGQLSGRKQRGNPALTQEQTDVLKDLFPKGYMTAKKLKHGGKMKLTPKELQKISNLGRFGDTRLAHVTPQEERMLKAMGGAGTINPYTGLPEYYGNPLSAITDVVSSVFTPVFNAAGSVIDPVVSNVVSPVVNTAGSAVNQAISTAGNLATDVIDTTGQTVSNVGQAGMDVVAPVISPVLDAAGDVIEPVVQGAANVIDPIAGGFLNLVDQGIQGGLNLVQDVGFGAMDVFETLTNPIGDILQGLLSGGGGSESLDFGVNQIKELRREAMEPTAAAPANIQAAPGLSQRLAQLQKKQKTKLKEGDFVSPKDNPFITPNVEEELDYAAQGMKMPNYNMGGILSQRANEAIALNEMSALTANAMRNRANQMKTGGKFKPHMMYDPKTGKAYRANKVEDHKRMSKKGYTHTKPNKKRNYTKGGRF